MKRKINFPMLFRIIGFLLILEGVFMAIPLVTAIIYGESDWLKFTITCAVTITAGLAMSHIKPATKIIGKREGFLLTSLVWVIFSLFGLIPLMMGPDGISFSSAFFESISSFTTTGASGLPSDSPLLTHSVKMWQALMQWLGGMGIIIFTVAIIPTLNSSGGMQMFNAEATGVVKEKIMPRISQTAIALWGVYSVLTLALIFLLWIGPMTLFDSICHAFGTLSTGGYSSCPGSISDYDSDYVLIVITVFMFLGGINIANIYRAVTGRWERLRYDEVIRVYIGVILSFTFLFAIWRFFESDVTSWRDVTILPLFQVVSTITSTGYMAPEFSILGSFILALTFIMMLSGGCAGSTSGGAKLDRLIYLHKFLGNELKLVTHPNNIYSVRMNGSVINPEIVSKVIAFLCLYFVSIAVGGLLLSMMGLPAVDSFFSSFACISNTGFGASVTGYGDDYQTIPEAAKWVLSLLMLVGRLEIYTVLVLLTPAFWKR